MNKKIMFCFSLILLASSAVFSQTEEDIWKQIAAGPSEENITALLAAYPESALLPKVAELLWGKCKAKGDKNSCELYIQFFSEGGHVQEAFEILSRTGGPGDIIEETGEALVEIIEALEPDAAADNAPANTPDNEETTPDTEPEEVEPLDPDKPKTAVSGDAGKIKTNKPGLPAGKRSGNKPETTPAKKSAVSFARVWMEHNRVVNNRKGVMIHLKFSITGYAGKPCSATARFLDEAGKAIADSNGKFVDPNGKVVTVRKFVPKTASTQYNDFTLFMPYGELHKKGKNKIIFYVTIRSGKAILAKTAKRAFMLTWK